MRVIIKKLDIINLFKTLYKAEKNHEKLDKEDEIIEMSIECKKDLNDLYKNTLYGI